MSKTVGYWRENSEAEALPNSCQLGLVASWGEDYPDPIEYPEGVRNL